MGLGVLLEWRVKSAQSRQQQFLGPLAGGQGLKEHRITGLEASQPL